MKKFNKIVASLMAVAAMATNMVGVSASASSTQSWDLRNVVGAPSSVQSYEQIRAYVSTKSNMSSCGEDCSVANWGISNEGQTSRVHYYGYYEYINATGHVSTKTTFSDKYHTIYTDSQSINYTNIVPKYKTCYVKYYLERYNGLNCSYSGSITFYD